MLYIRVRLNPSLGRPEPPTSFKEKLISLRGIVFLPIIFIVVIGGLYLGIFTPTEAGAAGAFSVLVFALVTRRFTTWSSLKESLLDTGQTTVMIFLIIVGILIFTSMLILTCPLIVPVVVALGYDPIWFGIIAIKMCEICLITPPVGLNVYVVRSVAPDIPIEDIFRGALPFFFMDVLTVAILIEVLCPFSLWTYLLWLY